MNNVIVALLCLSLASPALAGGLPAGKPAGLHQAQMDMNTGMLLLGGAALIAVIVAVATTGGDNPTIATSAPVGTA